ncbi:MAG: BtpA/SgcQ family protein [bacterium]|nr:BtpA/SgcQ family protein [bacterium]MDE0289991.1 BtpA/SgcQ family protein [bacterium]MDE0437220.1 BtpA/SgcQ family protein [bacterium]
MTSLQLIGMVHIGPLPGSPRYRPPLSRVVERAVDDASTLERAGFDAVLVENYGDAPYFADDVPDITVASMTRVAAATRMAVNVPVGVNVLRNDGVAALSIAAACEAHFVRVNVLSGVMYTDQGLIEGRAAQMARLRATLSPKIEILADLFVKHATPPPGMRIEEAAADLWHRAMSDGLILSGPATGRPTDPELVDRVRAAVPEARILVGSGVTHRRIAGLVGRVDGIIVGTATKEKGEIHRPVDAARAARIVRAARG